MNAETERLYELARALPPEARAAFVAEACGDDSRMRDELTFLLEHAESGEEFFEFLGAAVFSPSGVIAGDETRHATSGESDESVSDSTRSARKPDGLVGRTIGRYRIVSHIARGGMGTVYRAHDSRLDREVALKFLPPHLGADANAAERLLVEARAAAGLEHPNVCAIHEIGETDDGQPFIAMAFYEGETLKQQLRRGRLPVDEAVAIGTQVARALAAAHARGIVHRDVKPGNVMLTPDGTVKLLDFGLAKMSDATLTGPGVTLGTMAYMSPEQIAGGAVDRRTDLWSLGVVLYEMVTGLRPFRGASDRALAQAILHADAEPLLKRQPPPPERLEQIIDRLLRKRPPDRYGSATELLADLKTALLPQTRPARFARFGIRALELGKQRRVLLPAAAVIITGLVATAAWLGRRDEKTVMSGSLAPTQRILVADFANFTSDSLLADAVSHALRIDLARLPSVRLAADASVAATLRRMRREPGVRLTSELAREAAMRDGIRGVIGGEVREVGNGYVISAAMVEVATGEEVEAWRQTAHDRAGVIPAIDSLSAAIRTRVGETVASLKTAERLSHSTTSSLEALRLFSRAQQLYQRGALSSAASLLEEATRIDSTFANAQQLLATALSDARGHRSRALRAIAKAYQLRDRLSPYERYGITAVYDRQVLGDLPKAIDVFRNQIEAAKDAGDVSMYAALGRGLARIGDLPGAEAVLRDAPNVWPTPANHLALVMVLYQRGKVSEALAVLRKAMERYPAHPDLMTLRAELSIASGEYAVADSLAEALPSGARTGDAHRIQAISAAVQGRFDDAIGHFRAMRQEQLSAGLTDRAIEVSIAIGSLQLVTGDRRAGLAEVEQFLARHPLDSLDPLDRPYFDLARFFADAGQPARAREILRAYDREVPQEFRGVDRWSYVRTRAFIRLAEGKPDAALADLERISHDPPFPRFFLDDIFIPLSDRPELARAYDRGGRADSAIATYERYLGTRSAGRVQLDAFELPNVLVRMAELYESRGDSAAAARNYLRFAELWRNADAALQPRVEKARKRAARLTDLEAPKRTAQNR